MASHVVNPDNGPPPTMGGASNNGENFSIQISKDESPSTRSPTSSSKVAWMALVLALIAVILGAIALAFAIDAKDDDSNSSRKNSNSSAPAPTPDPSKFTILRPDARTLMWDSKSTTLDLPDIMNPGKRTRYNVTDGWLTTPLDFSDPAGEQVRVRFRVRFADIQPAPLGTMIFHGGGPSTGKQDGLDIAWIQSFADPVLFKNYDCVGVDQRGMYESAPPGVTNFTHAGTTHPIQPAGIFASTGPTCWPSNSSEAALREAVRETAYAKVIEYNNKAYAMKNGKNYRDFAGTTHLAHDLDLFRASIGLQKLSVYGVSYGTQVGGLYATLFPKRIDRLILSGGIPPNQLAEDFAYGAAAGIVETSAYVLQLLKHQYSSLANRSDEIATNLKKYGADPQATFNQWLKDVDNGDIKIINGTYTIPPMSSWRIQGGLGNPATWLNTLLVTASVLKRSDRDKLPATAIASWAALDKASTSKTTCTFGGGQISAVLGLDTAGILSEDAIVHLSDKALRNYGPLGRMATQFWALMLSGRGLAGMPMPKPASPMSNPNVQALVSCTLYDSQTFYGWSNKMATAFPSGMLLSWQGGGHGVILSKMLYAKKDALECQKKISEYIKTGSLDTIRATPVCKTKLEVDVTKLPFQAFKK